MTTPAGWETLGLAGDPTPGNPDEVRALAGRLLEQAKLAEDNTAKLNNVSSNSSALRMRGDYAGPYAEALAGLPTELAKLGRAYRGAGAALNTYADSLRQAKSQAGTALAQGRSADQQYQGALREVRAHLPATSTTSTLAETEAAVTAAAPPCRPACGPPCSGLATPTPTVPAPAASPTTRPGCAATRRGGRRRRSSRRWRAAGSRTSPGWRRPGRRSPPRSGRGTTS
ncbi:putative T7SS-secreted protein [Nonomuraea thailandensis]